MYVHIFNWPADGKLRIDGLAGHSARLLADGTSLPVTQDGSALVISLPAMPVDVADTVVVVQ